MSIAELPPPGNHVEHLDVAPHDDNAERQVLGAMLTNPRTAATLAEQLDGSDFYQLTHETIYEAIQERTLAGQPVDALIIADTLTRRPHGKKQTELDYIGGPATLHTLAAEVITVANADWHADRIIELALRRRAIQATRDILARLTTPGDQTIADIIETGRTALDAVPTNTTTEETSWTPLDLNALLDADNLDDLTPAPTVFARSDGHMLLYPQAIHSISGEPGSGKTWAAVLAAAQEFTDGHNVLYIDFEDRVETLISRLRSIGTPDHHIRNHLRYMRPQTALTPTGRHALDHAAKDCTLAVVDGITEAMTLHGLSLMDNEDVARWLALVPHHIANQGPAVLQIDHVVKNSEARGRYAIGGQHKLAGITGCAYKMLTIRSFGRGNHGQAKLVIDKDKHGRVGPNGATAAEIHLDARDPNATEAWIDPPQETSFSADGEIRPTHLMERVSVYLEHVADATGKQIESAVKGKRDYVRRAVRVLIAEGYVATSDGPRGSTLHKSLSAYREADDDQA